MTATEITSLYDFFEQFPDEQAAIDHLHSIRWKDGEYCPHCGHDKIYHFSDKRTHKCRSCRKRFSIKVGTIFEDTKLPLRKWFAAIWLITSHKKGIASTQLAKDLKITQKTAWFVLHRLRHAARTKSFNKPLEGDVELDETYVGGRESNKPKSKRRKGMQGGKGEAPVFGILERDGELRAKHVDGLDGKTIKSEVDANVDGDARLMTDESRAYNKLDKDYERHAVNHSAGEFVRGPCHINGLEGAWSLFKKQVNGTHHWISKKHFQKYLDEMCYRYNRRDSSEGGRINDFLSQTDGRLTYKALIDGETNTKIREAANA